MYKRTKKTFRRDVATRNCLIDTATLRTRLADAALSRDLFPQDYHCLGDNENRAIGWMALETLQHGQYSTASDTVSAIIFFSFSLSPLSFLFICKSWTRVCIYVWRERRDFCWTFKKECHLVFFRRGEWREFFSVLNVK